MNVLLLVSTRGLFGAENAVLELSRQLPLYGFVPHIGILENSGGLHRTLEEESKKNNLPVKVFRCRWRFDLGTALQIRKYVRENKIKLVHSQGYKSNFYNLISSLSTKTKKITTCHNWISNSTKMKLYESLDKMLLNKFDRVVVVSEDLRQEVLRNRIAKDKVVVIDNGIDLARFQPESYNFKIKELLGIKEDERLVGTVSRITKEKGHIYLLKAAQEVLKSYPKVKFLIVGDGPLRNSLQEQVCNLGIQNNVIFTGLRQDIPKVMNAIDIFVLPSLEEGMPMAALEAMASKKPVIATNVGAVHKIIKDGYTGLLIEPGDIGKLSVSISELLRDKGKAEFLAKNGYEKVRIEFSAKKMAENYVAVYNTLIANG